MEATHSVTWAQMQLSGYTDKDNWKKYPKEMMRARCLVYGCRALFPEVLSGFYTDMEMNDVSKVSEHEVDMTEDGEVTIQFNNEK
jgi:hypothetical protein